MEDEKGIILGWQVRKPEVRRKKFKSQSPLRHDARFFFHEQELFSFLSPRLGLLVFRRKRVQLTGPSAPKDARLGGG
jgi:hypothetical protein